MVGEVNKIISNLLLSRCGVFLPSVGSLGAEFVSAAMLSAKEITPPHNTIVFSSQPKGVSLPEEIMRIAGCTMEEAEDIYKRWLSKTLHDGELTIEGIGTLRFKNFIIDPAFDAILNPAGRNTRRLKPARHLWRIAGWCLSIIAIGGCGAAWWFYIDMHTTCETTADKPLVVAEPVIVETPPVPITDSMPPIETIEESLPDQEHATTVAPKEIQQPEQSKTYVIFGLFSSEGNARRAIAEATRNDQQATFSIYSAYGNKYLVSVFESHDREQCSDFIRHNSDRLGDLWPYTHK